MIEDTSLRVKKQATLDISYAETQSTTTMKRGEREGGTQRGTRKVVRGL